MAKGNNASTLPERQAAARKNAKWRASCEDCGAPTLVSKESKKCTSCRLLALDRTLASQEKMAAPR